MSRRVVWIVVVLLLLGGGYVLWERHHAAQELASGDVHCDGCMTPAEHARFIKENAGEGADGASEQKDRTARQEAATVVEGGSSTSSDSRVASKPAASRGALGLSAGGELRANPDTLPANAQEGARLVGSGPYQWYRQGNLTWRVDTSTGRSCIVYATLEEWRKAIVLSHGCGRKA